MTCSTCRGRKKVEGDTMRLTELSHRVLSSLRCPRCQGAGRVAEPVVATAMPRKKFRFNKLLRVLLARFKKERAKQVFRFNERDRGDGSRFDAVMRCVIGRRLTYRQLCAVGGCGFMGIE